MLAEVKIAIEIHAAMGSRLHGVHLEMTANNVTECIGGEGPALSDMVDDCDIEAEGSKFMPTNYETSCDPRLNYKQSIRFTRYLAQYFAKQNGKSTDIIMANGTVE